MTDLACAIVFFSNIALADDPHRNISRPTAGYSIRASEAGAQLDTDLMNGGGTDDTAVLQGVLDRAKEGRSLRLTIDGPALVSGLNVYGHTVIECLNGGGLYLKDGSSRAIVRNAHRSRDNITDRFITIRGCFLNGNRENQPSAAILRSDTPVEVQKAGADSPVSNREADGTWLSGLQFLGVNDLTIEQVTLWNVRAFGALIANGERVTIRDVTIDHGGPANVDAREILNTDGLHFKGPLRYVSVDGLRARVGDDALALNADDFAEDDVANHNDFGPYVRSGPITDVVVNNVQLMETADAIRLLSAKQRIDRVVISNVSGTIRGAPVVKISHWYNPTSLGNFGSIQFSNLNVDRVQKPTQVLQTKAEREKWKRLEGMHEDWFSVAFKEYGREATLPLFNINGHVEHLTLRNVISSIAYEQPIIRFGPDTQIQMMTAELSLRDPKWQATPVVLEAGAQVRRLNLTLDWMGDAVDQNKGAISDRGGTINELNWVNTPPRFVGARLESGNSIVVRFNQAVKAEDYRSGVLIKVNGVAADISSAFRDRDQFDSVHYMLSKAISPQNTISWAYDANCGFIRNAGGDGLASIPASPVKRETHSRHP